MITDEGKIYIKGYLGGQTPSIAQSIALGLGNAAPLGTDAKLQFEIEREDISLSSYDFNSDTIVFKCPILSIDSGLVYEIGLYGSPASAADAAMLVSTFDSETEEWLTDGLDPVFNDTATRAGDDSLNMTPALSTTSTAVLSDLGLDLSTFTNADKFVLAYNVGNANTSTITLKLLTDDANYYSLSYPVANGYNINEVAKSAAVPTGTPDWSVINEIQMVVTSKASGSSNINFDALRIDIASPSDPSNVLIAREVLSPAFVREVNKSQELEFRLAVSI